MAKNIVTSEEHVDVKLTNGTLRGDRLRVYGGGEVVRFEGNVVMNLDSLNSSSPDQPAAAPAAPVEPPLAAKSRSVSKPATSK
jgi:lipopolysaccharide export system protein LptC